MRGVSLSGSGQWRLPQRAVWGTVATVAIVALPGMAQEPPSSVAGLTDGTYRYCRTGVVADPIQGPVPLECFLFRKVQARITGILVPVANVGSICVSGIPSGNTIVGEAQEPLLDGKIPGSQYAGTGKPPQDALLLSQGELVNPGFVPMVGARAAAIQWRSALLNLDGFQPAEVSSLEPLRQCESQI